MKNSLLLAVAAAGIAFAAPQAFASTVTLNGFTFGTATTATVQSAAPGTPILPFSVYAGQYSGTLDGKSFISYCVELTQALQFNTTYNDYQAVSGIDAWGAAKSAQFDRLISALFGANTNSNANGSGLAQTAIWETLYETSASNGFASGTFRAASTNPMFATANALDWSILNTVPVRYHVDLLHSASAQDLMLITALAVPEPSEIALLLVGGLGFGFFARRRAAGGVRRPALPFFA